MCTYCKFSFYLGTDLLLSLEFILTMLEKMTVLFNSKLRPTIYLQDPVILLIYYFFSFRAERILSDHRK